MIADVLTEMSEHYRDLYEAVVDAAQILDTVLDLREVDFQDDGYDREPVW